MELGYLYELADFPDYAERVRSCATFLQFGVYSSGERRLQAANFCKLRLCPMCISRKARRNAYKLSQILNQVEEEHGAKFLFLTLTIKNVDGDGLRDAIGQLTASWYRLMDQRQIERSVKGWFRAIEITRRGKGYHPHIHAILAVDADYFSRESRRSGKYLNQSDLIERWRKALRVDYKPSVSIEVTKAKAKEGEVLRVGGGAAALEASKYTVKERDYIDRDLPEKKAAQIVRDYTLALHRRRLTAFGGWMKDAARLFDAEDLDGGDLVKVDEEIRTDVLQMVEEYHWRLGAGDFILTRRDVDPLQVTATDPDPRPQPRVDPPDPVEVEHPEDDLHPFWVYEDESPWDGA